MTPEEKAQFLAEYRVRMAILNRAVVNSVLNSLHIAEALHRAERDPKTREKLRAAIASLREITGLPQPRPHLLSWPDHLKIDHGGLPASEPIHGEVPSR